MRIRWPIMLFAMAVLSVPPPTVWAQDGNILLSVDSIEYLLVSFRSTTESHSIARRVTGPFRYGPGLRQALGECESIHPPHLAQ